MTDVWRQQTYHLRFYIGDIGIGEKKIPVMVRSFGLAEMLTSDLDAFDLNKAMADGNETGYLIRCLPWDVAGEATLACKNGYFVYLLDTFPRHYTDLSNGFDAYCKNNFSNKTRATLQRKARKFAEHCGGKLQWRVYRSEEELAEFHNLARSISVATYQERLLDAGLPDSDSFRQEAAALARQDRVRAFLLFEREKPVAYLYLPADGDALVYAYLGYLPDYGSWSVGTILQWLALEFLFGEQRFRYLDFTEGTGQHKELFATGCCHGANVLILRKRIASRGLIGLHRATNQFSGALGRVFERFGLKARIKRFIRRGHLG